MVWRTAHRLLGRSEEARDCLQDTFLSALEVSRRQRVRSWGGLLRYLATARALDRLRSRTKRERHRDLRADPATVVSTDADPIEIAEAEELMTRLRLAIAQLPERQAEVFSLHFLEQMTPQGVAVMLGMNSNAVSTALHKARLKLRALLLLHKEKDGGKP